MSHRSTTPAGPSPENGPPADPEWAAHEAVELGMLAQRLLLDQLGRCSIPLTLIFIMGVVRGIQDGFESAGALALLVGAFVSGVATFLYALPTAMLSYGRRKQPWMPMSAVGGIVAYAFGLYLILVLGLWNQVRAPSLGGAGLGLFFLLMGFWFLRGLGRVAELAKRIDRTLESEAESAERIVT